MFTWKIEENKLNKERSKCGYSTFTFNAESISAEEKVEFIDRITNGALTYILNLATKYEEALLYGTIKKTNGNINSNSRKAWIKKNDIRGFISAGYDVGVIKFPYSLKQKTNVVFPERRIGSINTGSFGDRYNDFVDETFHRTLNSLADAERRYFYDHDEYALLQKEACDYIERFGTFGNIISYGANGVLLYSDNSDNANSRKLTTDELNAIIEKGKTVQATIDKLSEDKLIF